LTHPSASSIEVHPTAIVARGAELGEGVEVGAYCVVGPHVRIGPHTKLHSHVVVDGDTTIGEGCEVFSFAVLGKAPQDKKLQGPDNGGRLVIGGYNRIREHVTIHGGTPYGGGVTSVGSHNMLLASAHIGHDSTVGDRVVFTNGAMVAGHTTIEDQAILGAMVGIHQYARVGRLAMIGAGAMLSRDAPPFALVQGDRARLVGVNLIGMKRAGLSPEEVADVKRCFRLLFWRAEVLEERLDSVRRHLGGERYVQEILKFVADSRRGICRPRGKLDSSYDREIDS
jgi:UDP-N-acetylglucosamine acyltransferase